MSTYPSSPTPADIRTARLAAGLTQTQAAALVYVTLRCWQRWETGERVMHAAFFELFHHKLVQLGAWPSPARADIAIIKITR